MKNDIRAITGTYDNPIDIFRGYDNPPSFYQGISRRRKSNPEFDKRCKEIADEIKAIVGAREKVCSECQKPLNENDHNYGSPESSICPSCYKDAMESNLNNEM